MLRAREIGIVIWGNISSPTLAAVRRVVDAIGAHLAVRELPHRLDPYGLQPKGDTAAEAMHERACARSYGCTQLKLQLPLRSVIVWRTQWTPRL
jgi:hypothetical protein